MSETFASIIISFSVIMGLAQYYIKGMKGEWKGERKEEGEGRGGRRGETYRDTPDQGLSVIIFFSQLYFHLYTIKYIFPHNLGGDLIWVFTWLQLIFQKADN